MFNMAGQRLHEILVVKELCRLPFHENRRSVFFTRDRLYISSPIQDGNDVFHILTAIEIIVASYD